MLTDLLHHHQQPHGLFHSKCLYNSASRRWCIGSICMEINDQFNVQIPWPLKMIYAGRET